MPFNYSFKKWIFYSLLACLCLGSVTPKAYCRPELKIVKNISYKLDAAQHNSKDIDFVEWWYFNGTIDEDLSFLVSFYTSTKDNFVELTLYDSRKDQRQRYVSNFLKNDIAISREKCLVKMGNNVLSGHNGIYTVCLNHEDFFLKFNLIPTVQSIGYLVRFPKKSLSYWCWMARAPRGKIEGELRVGGKVIKFSRLGYHEHCYFPYRAYFPRYKRGGWLWGRYFTKNYTIIMDRTVDPKIKAMIFLFKNTHLIYPPNKNNLFFTEKEAENIKHGKLPEKIDFKLDNLDVSILNKGISFSTKYVIRFVSEIRIQTTKGKTKVTEEGEGATEVIY